MPKRRISNSNGAPLDSVPAVAMTKDPSSCPPPAYIQVSLLSPSEALIPIPSFAKNTDRGAAREPANRAHDWHTDSIHCQGDRFVDSHGRTLMLRGVNLCGNSKLPTSPPGSTHLSNGFYNHRQVSFVGRPFPLAEADEHFRRLRTWGLTFVRLLVPWESLEHDGPGIYDEQFIDYLIKIIKKGAAYGIKCFIDPHQDTWSRFSGGSGAPGWTFEVAGLDLTSFKDTGAAYLQQFASDDDSYNMIWPTNYTKLASATMFTLFFGGNIFAPKTRYQGEPVQDFLQRHFIECYRHLAERLKHLDAVVGFEVLNEPHCGFIGLQSLHEWNELKELRLGDSPSALQSFLLGEGVPQKVPIFSRSWPWPTRKDGVKLVNEGRRRAWLPGRRCIWRENGVWDLSPDGSKAINFQIDYFTKKRDGSPVSFNQDCYLPMIKSFITVIKSVKKSYLTFFEPIPAHDPPVWTDSDDIKDGLVYAPHWYDLKSVFSKSFDGIVTHDVQGLSRGTKNVLTASYFGIRGAKANYAGQIKNISNTGVDSLGRTPCLFGECGIPMDLNDKKAFETGDYTTHNMFLDAVISSMEENMVHFTLWNYNPINDNVFGDHWNGEDFSIFTSSQSPPSNKLEDINPSQMSSSEESIAESPSKRSPVLRKTKSFGAHLLVNTSGAKTIDGISMSRTRGSSPNPITPKSLFDLNEFFDNPAETPFCEHHEGGRALDAVVRPYATKISGIPRRMRFDYKTRDFFLSFAEAPANAGSQDSKNLHRTTELFIPSYQYGGQEVCVTVSDGTFKYDTRNQSLYWVYDPSAKPRSTNEAHIFGDESIVRTMWRILGLLLSWILSLFFGIYFNGADRPDGGEALHWIHVSPVTKIPKRRHFF